MSKEEKLDFGSDAIAKAYDNYLVPALFDPWARELIKDHGPWNGKHVLDLATGTGVVTKLLAQEVGQEGKIIAADFNKQMLDLARQKCVNETASISFIECSADNMSIEDETVDVVVCQQGFQFFPDKLKAAEEINRVLKPGGKVIVTTWRPVEECEFFGALCSALEGMGEVEVSRMMRMPFDLMPQQELKTAFDKAGFSKVKVSTQEKNMTIEVGAALELAYATPIGPKLMAMNNENQKEFGRIFEGLISKLGSNDRDMGRMRSNILEAYK